MAIETSGGDEEKKRMEALVRRVRRKTLDALQYAGEAAIAECKMRHGYTDRTGKLTASMGYGIKIGDTTKVAQCGTAAGDGSGTSDGRTEGEQYIKEVMASEIQGEQYGVTIAAGAEYAKFVAERRAVLENGEPVLKSTLDTLLSNIK